MSFSRCVLEEKCNVQESLSNPRTTLIDFNNAACPNSNGQSQVCCEEKKVKKEGNTFFDFEEEKRVGTDWKPFLESKNAWNQAPNS